MKMFASMKALAPAAIAAMAVGTLGLESATAKDRLAAGEVKVIAEEAFVYGFPMVMSYAIYYESFVDTKSSQYKAPFNQLYNTARVYTPADTAVVTPNSDTPYSFIGMDLRAEPVVICNPEIEKSRYFSLQLIDMYTFNYGYMGTRTSGNAAQCALIAGPRWKGKAPDGIAKVFRSETAFSLGLIRTQLFNGADLDNVKKIQAGYRAVPLSKFLGRAAPAAAPAVQWPMIDKELAAKDPFTYLNFLLTFTPATGPAAVEAPMRARFAKIGILPGKPFNVRALSAAQKEELEAGVKSGLEKIKATIDTLGRVENGWRVATSAFGDRAMYGADYARRAAAAMAGIYGNDASEALYPMLAADSEGKKPDTGVANYALTFPAGSLPPTKAFWSVTMYDGKTQLLIDNPINRYLINSPMLPDLKKNPDGSLTLLLQKESPGPDKTSNWLPAPNGPAYIVMRIYWPEPTALNGAWKPPVVQPVKLESSANPAKSE
ncbi:DUF1254 domain-containing protein [Rhodopseudomonas palustris]|uniref:Uncharacterized conserved protein n=2 Tax=Rhodopseudomonas pseudopalustris TaxID=1513892 RepID=A0A1H8R0J1_9BRAD|nr:DUF1254 domain-containing protein [Rhodopseudomonas pseudopalustris]MBB1090487.1 DUF1254 domain-containing protein [Rhodopseudomonas palustris]SEO59856.1 Uncharacterized conserved protein [Rhodopseudomonas pseudopalustris]